MTFSREATLRGCVQCGSRKFRKVIKTISTEFRDCDLTASIGVPGRQCTKCKETYVDGSVKHHFQLAVGRELADLGVQTGEAIRHMRKALGLRASDLAHLLDLTPETISHWETGKARINRAAFVALGAMIQDAIEGRSTTRDRLAALGDERPYPRVLSPKLL